MYDHEIASPRRAAKTRRNSRKKEEKQAAKRRHEDPSEGKSKLTSNEEAEQREHDNLTNPKGDGATKASARTIARRKQRTRQKDAEIKNAGNKSKNCEKTRRETSEDEPTQPK